jgi:hypothetical protein
LLFGIFIIRAKQIQMLYAVSSKTSHSVADRYQATKAIRLGAVAETILFLSAVIGISTYSAQLVNLNITPVTYEVAEP